MHVPVHPILIFSLYSPSIFSKPSFWPSILSFNVSTRPVFLRQPRLFSLPPRVRDWRGLGMLLLTLSPLFFMSLKRRNMFEGVLDIVFYRVEKRISHVKWWGVRHQRSRKVHFAILFFFFRFPSHFDSLSGERLINCSILSYIELRAANDLRHWKMERKRGAAKKMDQFFEIKEQLFSSIFRCKICRRVWWNCLLCLYWRNIPG